MLRTRALLFVVATIAVGGAAIAACGGDDIVNTTPGDGGTATDGPILDGPSLDSGDAGDAGDGGPCDFNQFVMGLIQNHTNSKDLPSVDLGQNCVDKQAPFPSTVFQ